MSQTQPDPANERSPSPPADSATPPPTEPPPAAAPPPRRRRRRWPWVILIILLILVGLVVLAPTIASTAPVRSFVVGRINNNLNGRLTIDTWSLGWTSGIRASGVRLYDDRNAEILDAPRIQTQLTLLEALRGNYDLGETVIDVHNFVLRIDESGTNFERVLRTEPGEDAPAARDPEPGELPDIRGNITLNYRGTVVAEGYQPVHIQPSTATLNIPDINQPITNDLRLVYRVGDQDPGTITAAGSINFAQNHRVQLEQLSGRQEIGLSNVDLAAAGPVLQQAMPEARIAGVASGAMNVTLQGLTGISAAGEIVVAEPLFSGGPLAPGDVVTTQRLTIPVQITRTELDSTTTLIRIERLALEMPEATLTVSGQVPEQALLNLAENRAPGYSGQVQINTNVRDLPTLAERLRHTARLEGDVRITGGTISNVSTIDFHPDRVVFAQTFDAAASGTRAGQPITLRPIRLELAAAALPGQQRLPELRDLSLMLQSTFATVRGGGESLAALEIDSKFDLGAMQQELGQFVNFGDVRMTGNGHAALTTAGDPTVEAQPIEVRANATVQNLQIAGVAAQPIAEDRLTMQASGRLHREAGRPAMLRGASLSVTSGDPAAPLLDVQANADVNLENNTVPAFHLARLNVTNLAQLQQQYGAVVPGLREQGVSLDGGEFYATAAGSFDGTTLEFAKPLELSMPNLTVSRNGRQLVRREIVRVGVLGTVSLPEDSVSATLRQLSITTQSNLLSIRRAGEQDLRFTMAGDGTIRGNGAVTLAADLARLNAVIQAFAAEVTVDPRQPNLRSGLFEGTITLARADQPQTDLRFNGKVTQLTVSSAGETPINNEQVTITIAAVAPDSPTLERPITASGQVGSTFIESTLKDVRVVPQAGTWDMVQSAQLQANAPDLAKLYAVINALMPPGAPEQPRQASADVAPRAVLALAMLPQDVPVRGDEPISRPRPAQRAPAPGPAPAPAPDQPLAPLEVTGGGASLTASLRRDNEKQTTQLDVTDLRISQLALRRGEQTYAFDRDQPISLRLSSEIRAVDAADQSVAQQISSVRVTQLAGDLRVAQVTMPQPVTLTNLAANVPTAQGSIRAEGTIEAATPLLAVLMGGEPLPYAGAYVLIQNLRSQAEQLALEGELTATNFQVLDPADPRQPRLTEEKLSVRNALTADLTRKVAQIQTLTIDMASSGALRMNVKGFVENWGADVNGATAHATFRDVVADVSYDLERIWPIVRPMIATPDETYEDVAVVGQYQRQFTINGPLYAGEMHEMLRELQVVGAISIARFVYPGAEVSELEIPVYLRRGVLQTVYAGRPAAERNPPPAAFNGGTLSIGGWSLDLTQPSPRLTIPSKYQLVRQASINPLLGDRLGKFVNPLFPNSQRAQGLLDVRIDYCENVALGEALRGPQSGRARIVFSITDLDIANPLGSMMLGPVIEPLGKVLGAASFQREQADTFQGSVRDAVVTLENGRTKQDVTLELIDTARAADVIGAREPVRPTPVPMRFQGDINLSDLSQSINVNMPTALLHKFIRSERDQRTLAQIFPEGIPLSLRGTTIQPRIDVGNIGQKIIEAQIRGLVPGEGDPAGLLEDILRRRERERDRQQEKR